MGKTFKQVIIKSENDLPKETGSYLSCFKQISGECTIITRFVAFEKDSLHPQGGINWWLNNIDWYLIEQPSTVNAEEIKNNLIDSIHLDEANLAFILQHKIINGTLRLELHRILDDFARQSLPELTDEEISKTATLYFPFEAIKSTNTEGEAYNFPKKYGFKIGAKWAISELRKRLNK